jgi:hypothetical protein
MGARVHCGSWPPARAGDPAHRWAPVLDAKLLLEYQRDRRRSRTNLIEQGSTDPKEGDYMAAEMLGYGLMPAAVRGGEL